MKLFLIDPLYKHFYKNGMFNLAIDPAFITSVNARNYLLKKGIILDTIDLHPLEKADKIFFLDHQDFSFFNKFNPHLKSCLQKKIPKKKLNLIITECPVIKPETWSPKNHTFYDKIFTWDETIVDNKKYFFYYWVQNIESGKIPNIPFFKKKLLTLINAQKTNYLPNELYSLRIKAIRFFEKKHPSDFDLYGIGWGKPLKIKHIYSALKYKPHKIFSFVKDYFDSLRGFPSYKDQVADKISVLSKYKFSICFENMQGINGYVTEKIFDSFKAHCVPVYLGAKNIDQLVSPNTFIDFCRFANFDDLYRFMTNMDEKTYNQYLSNIDEFLKSTRIKKWGPQSFCQKVYLHEK